MMYTIGQFSLMVKIPCKTLRYYDEIDLLKPAKTDYQNSYRYYDHQSVLQAQQVLVYRHCGLPLEKIRQIMHAPVTGNDLHNILASQLDHLEKEINEMQQSRSRIQEIILSLEEKKMNEIEVKERPEQAVLAIRKRGGHDTIPEVLSELFSAAAMNGLEICGPHSIIWHEEKDFTSDAVEMEILLPVDDTAGPDVPYLVRREKQLVCSCIHTGNFATVSSGYERLFEYTAQNGYAIDGPFEERYLSDIRKVRPSEFQTEISVPIKSK
ncbi:MAG: MerR family transcriptional regulator [Spirochaetales bacterium]|nr:MerR family transcriptional regulator [Spirochaetales bacterium]